MTLLDYVAKINHAVPMLSDTYAAHLSATLDGMPFDAEGMQRRRDWYNDQHERIMEFLERDCPDLGQRDRLIICDLRMSEIREHIMRTEAEFGCYRQILDRCTPRFASVSDANLAQHIPTWLLGGDHDHFMTFEPPALLP